MNRWDDNKNMSTVLLLILVGFYPLAFCIHFFGWRPRLKFARRGSVVVPRRVKSRDFEGPVVPLARTLSIPTRDHDREERQRIEDEAASALQNLGMKKQQARQRAQEALAQLPHGGLEQVLQVAFRRVAA